MATASNPTSNPTKNPFGDDATVSDWEDRDSSGGGGDSIATPSSSAATSLVAPPSIVSNTAPLLPSSAAADPPPSAPAPPRAPSRRPWIGPVASSDDDDDECEGSSSDSARLAGGRSSRPSSGSSHRNSNPFEEEEEEEYDEGEEEEGGEEDQDQDGSHLGIAPLTGYYARRLEPPPSRGDNPFDVASTQADEEGGEEVLEAYRHALMRGALIQGLAPPSSTHAMGAEGVEEEEEEEQYDEEEGEEEQYDPRASPYEEGGKEELALAPVAGDPNQGDRGSYYDSNANSGSSGKGSRASGSASTPDKEYYYESSRSNSTLSKSAGGGHPGGRSAAGSGSGSVMTRSRSSAGQTSTEPPDSDYAPDLPHSIWGTAFQARRTVSIPIHQHHSASSSNGGAGTDLTAASSARKRGAWCRGAKGRCTLWALLAVTLLLVGAVVAVSLLLFRPKGPSMDEQVDAVLRSVSDPSALADGRTPQAKAREWILYEDTYWSGVRNMEAGGIPTQRVVQRYALAVLYYATNGPTSWGKESSAGGGGGANGNHGWLLGGECDDPEPWHGLACDSDGEVRAVGFGTGEGARGAGLCFCTLTILQFHLPLRSTCETHFFGQKTLVWWGFCRPSWGT
jgi:hypothetical protein